MNVRQLVERLKQCDPDKLVLLRDTEWGEYQEVRTCEEDSVRAFGTPPVLTYAKVPATSSDRPMACVVLLDF